MSRGLGAGVGASGRYLECTDQPVGLGQELLDILKARAARGAGAQVQLDLPYLGEFQLSIE
jgi:hypothetical protein